MNAGGDEPLANRNHHYDVALGRYAGSPGITCPTYGIFRNRFLHGRR